ncbi:MAG: NUDIX hydrolase [Bacteriovorax sp.]|nr:NUDIX hydrolase [Bacteriovorax sp.]
MKKNHYYYRGVNPTVDLIIFNPFDEVLMIRRSRYSEACPSMFAFPGGFIDSNALAGEMWERGLETPKEAALRELAEETNFILEQEVELIPVGVYVGDNRDPRDNQLSWSQSYAFTFKINREIFEAQKNNIKGLDDADMAQWIGILELQKMELAFDHKRILSDTLKLFSFGERNVRSSS